MLFLEKDIYDEMAKLNLDIQFHAGNPDMDFIQENIEQGRCDTLIFDDLAKEMSQKTVELYNVLSHHMNANVVYVVSVKFTCHSKYYGIFRISGT